MSIEHATRPAARRALVMAALAVVMELGLITPWVDHLADKNATIHSTQHGLIFLGGVLIGYALRELSRR